MAADVSLKKNYAGPIHGGEGKEDVHYKTEPEPGAIHGGEGKHIGTVGGQADKRDGSEEKGFSLQAKGYAGPENWTATNKGVVNPDDISH